MVRKRLVNQMAGPDWYLREWMAALQVTQADLARETGWSKATMNDIYHGKTSYYRQILNEAAAALHVEPFELLMPPDRAMARRRMQESAIRIAAEQTPAYHPPPRDGTDG